VYPVEIDNRRRKLGNRRDRVNLVPVPENIFANNWREIEVWIIIGLIWIVNDIALITHTIGHYALFATII
jgi:hypothetical protein